MAATTSTRSRAVKRTSSMRQAPQRSSSADSLAGTSLASSHALDVDELNINNINSNSYHHDNNHSTNEATLSTHESMGSLNGEATRGNSNHIIADGGDIEALQSGPMSRSSILVPMEIRTLPEIGSAIDDGKNGITRSIIPNKLRSWTAKQPSSWMSILDNPSQRTGRLLVLGASAIYGTNFATVKLLDDAMPLSVSVRLEKPKCHPHAFFYEKNGLVVTFICLQRTLSHPHPFSYFISGFSLSMCRQAALRFGLASSVVSAIVLGRESDDVDAMVEKERNLAFWSGAEIGLWYSIGYLAQAEGLQTVAAGKVSAGNGW
jgi:hypothetical protein